ncbi:MAG: glycosyltransferase [Thermodesulfobacteriota bacterium]|nr:glycosyltransferase [Thermodesulfobacteriota bacterium]
MKHIYIITGDFPPSSKVGALRPFRLAKRLSASGWQVNIITKRVRIDFSHNNNLLDELNDRVSIHYLPGIKKPTTAGTDDQPKLFSDLTALGKLMVRIKGTAWERLGQYIKPDLELMHIPAYIFKFLKISKKTDRCIVLTTSPPHSIHITGLILHTLTRIPYITDFRDPWDYYPQTGKYEITNPLERLLEKTIIKHAAAVISTTRMYNENLKKRHSAIDPDKFHCITNSFDIQKTSKTPSKPSEKFIISYTGIFYPEKDPFTFFRALGAWLDNLDETEKKKLEQVLEVRLIGSHSRHVAAIVENLGISKVVRFYARVPHEEAIRLTKMSDMLLICAGIGNKSRPGWLPSKLIEYLGCQIPIMAICREGEMASVIRDTKSGYVITSENHHLIQSILKKEIEKKLTGTESSDFSFQDIKQFQEDVTMKKFSKIINEIAINHIKC